jgi:hypothetical protein
MSGDREDQAVPDEGLDAEGAQAVDLIGDLDPDPIFDSGMPNHDFLPARLVCGGHLVGIAVRDGDRSGQLLLASDIRGHGQDGGAVATSGKGHQARWPAERSANRRGQRVARRDAGRRRRQRWCFGIRLDHDSRGQLEPRQRVPVDQTHLAGGRSRVSSWNCSSTASPSSHA